MDELISAKFLRAQIGVNDMRYYLMYRKNKCKFFQFYSSKTYIEFGLVKDTQKCTLYILTTVNRFTTLLFY